MAHRTLDTIGSVIVAVATATVAALVLVGSIYLELNRPVVVEREVYEEEPSHVVVMHQDRYVPVAVPVAVNVIPV